MNFEQWFQIFSKHIDFLKWLLGTVVLGGFIAYINHVIQKKKLEIEELKHLGTFKEIVTDEKPERAIRISRYFEVLSPGKDHQERWRKFRALLEKDIQEKNSKSMKLHISSESGADILASFEKLKEGEGDHPALIKSIEEYLSHEEEVLKALYERNIFMTRIERNSDDRILYNSYMKMWKQLIDTIHQIKRGRDVSYKLPELPDPAFYPDYPQELLDDIRSLVEYHQNLDKDSREPIFFDMSKRYLTLHTKVRIVITTMNFVFGFRN